MCVIPLSLELLLSHETGGACYGAYFTNNGKLVVGCHDGICVYSDDYNKADLTLKAEHVTSISSPDDSCSEIIFIEHHGHKCSLSATLVMKVLTLQYHLALPLRVVKTL